MTERDQAAAPRRILVALEAGEGAPALLETAASLAAGLHAELVGLIVQDSELLVAADLPVTRFISSHAQAHARLEARLIRRALKISESKAGDAFVAAAEHRRVKWSIRVVRGTMEEKVLAEARSQDLLALGTPGKAVRRARLSAASRVVAGQAPCTVLLIQAAGGAGLPVTVVYDGSERALVAGEQLARIHGRSLVVLAAGDTEAAAAILEKQAGAWLDRQGGAARVRPCAVESTEEICAALASRPPSVVVLDSEGGLLRRISLESLLGALKCSVLVLR
jgi:hypothetical protein